jgi:hypothetical protein
MANRVMAAKGLKLKRQRRLFPRYLSGDYVPTGKPPNQLVMREMKERARSLAFDDEYAEYLALRKYMDRQGQHLHPGRLEVQAHLDRIQNTMPALMCVTLCDSLIKKVKLFYNEERNRFLILEASAIDKMIQTSMVYMDRGRCLAAWKAGTIRWVHFSSVRPPPSSSE